MVFFSLRGASRLLYRLYVNVSFESSCEFNNYCLYLPKAWWNSKTNPIAYHSVAVGARFGVQLEAQEKYIEVWWFGPPQSASYIIFDILIRNVYKCTFLVSLHVPIVFIFTSHNLALRTIYWILVKRRMLATHHYWIHFAWRFLRCLHAQNSYDSVNSVPHPAVKHLNWILIIETVRY